MAIVESEKKAIERATAEGFIPRYNKRMKASFRITEHLDGPDIRCSDEQGNNLFIEVTMTEDKPKDIAACLDRSNHRSIAALKDYNSKVKRGEALQLDKVSSFSGNVKGMLLNTILRKKDKVYGPNTLLLIRDTSALDWEWDLIMEDIRRELAKLESLKRHYDKGIWIISYGKDKIFRVL